MYDDKGITEAEVDALREQFLLMQAEASDVIQETPTQVTFTKVREI